MVFEEHLGTGLKAIWKIGNNMYATVILYLQSCQLHMEYHRIHTRTVIIYLYINDLANVSENLFSILFTDDTTVLIEGTNINTMIATLNCELANILFGNLGECI